MNETRDLVRVAFRTLNANNQNPTIRAIQAYVLATSGVKCSPNLVSEELKKLKETAADSPPRDPQGVDSHTTQPLVVNDPQTEELSVKLKATEEILALTRQENNELRKMVRKQSDSLASLNTYFAEQIRSMAKETIQDLATSRTEMNQQIDKLLESRKQDQEQWDGLRKFLMEETYRIRTAEEGKNELLRRKIQDLEQMVMALTQAKNAAYDELGRLKLKYES